MVHPERRKIIDVLADRESATVEIWFKEHPGAEVVCSLLRGLRPQITGRLPAPETAGLDGSLKEHAK
jgi:hypothetical protein